MGPLIHLLTRFWQSCTPSVKIILALFAIAPFAYLLPDKPKSVQSDAASSSAPVRSSACIKAGGNIYTGVQLYSDRSCKQPYALILGGSNSQIALRLDNGAQATEPRSVVAEQYVKGDDPAIERRAWIEP